MLPGFPHAQKLPPNELALVSADKEQTWDELQRETADRSTTLSGLTGKRIGLVYAPSIESINQFFGLVRAQAHVYLIGANTPEATLDDWSKDFELDAILKPDGSTMRLDAPSKQANPGAITILTSGTTGKPKAAEHTWESLSRPVRLSEKAAGDRWLLTYQPHLYAGLQVMLQCLLNYGTLILPGPASSAEDVARLASSRGVQYVSATPSYWRWLLTLAGGERLRDIPLRQITLGGEVVDQVTLESLKQVFPETRIVHIYATTELGRCFSVTDGRAGFPARFLDKPSSDGVEMRVESGELVVRSANSMSRYDRAEALCSLGQGWFPTGDLVRVVDDRVMFVGRKTDMINVGGNKVYPVEVESVVRSVPGVADTRVYGETSSIVGELVKCDLVVETGFTAAEVEKAVRAKTLADLAAHQRPRLISIVEEIPRTAAGKAKRD